MFMRKNKNFFILILTTLFCCMFVTAFAGESDTHSIKWKKVPDGTTILDDNITIECKPNNNKEQSYVMNVTFSYSGYADKYGVEIHVPAHLFKRRDGKKIGIFVMPIPEYYPAYPAWSEPENAATKFNWRLDEKTDEIVISNYREIEETLNFSIDIEYKGIFPSLIKDGYYDDSFSAYLKVKDKNDGEQGPFYSNNVKIKYSTKADLNSITKNNNEKVSYDKWQPEWGNPPENMDTKDYFFVRWEVKADASIDDTQPFNVRFKEINSGADKNGILFGVESSKTGNKFTRIDLDTYNNPKEGDTFNNPYAYMDHPESDNQYRQDKVYWKQYLYYMYPKTLIGEDKKATVENSIDCTITGIDSGTSTKTASAKYTYSEATPTPVPTPTPAPTVPPNHIDIKKYDRGITYEGINELEDSRESGKALELVSYDDSGRGTFFLRVTLKVGFLPLMITVNTVKKNGQRNLLMIN